MLLIGGLAGGMFRVEVLAQPAASVLDATGPPGPPRPGIVLAQAPAASPIGDVAAYRRQQDLLFQRMLRRPTDIDLILEFARVSTLAGDLEGAIMAYERLLVIDANLPRVQFELAFLYHRLNSHDLARSYAEQALASPDLPADVRERLQPLMSEIDRTSGRRAWSASLTLGARYQTNANAGPGGGSVRSLGQDISLSSGQAGRHDWNAFLAASGRHIHGVGDGDSAIDSTVSLYASRQVDTARLHYSSLDARSGYRFRPFATTETVSLRPHLIGGISTLGDRRYASSGGVGMDINWRPRQDLSIDTTAEARKRSYHNSSVNSGVSVMSAVEPGVQTQARYYFTNDTSMTFDLTYRFADARVAWWTLHEFSAGTSITTTLPAFLTLTDKPGTVTLAGGRTWTNYRGPDPDVDPDVTRHDRQWQGSLTIAVPLGGNWSVYSLFQHALVSSNLPNYTYRNTTAMMGVTLSFQ
jgi:hypothetical protein